MIRTALLIFVAIALADGGDKPNRQYKQPQVFSAIDLFSFNTRELSLFTVSFSLLQNNNSKN